MGSRDHRRLRGLLTLCGYSDGVATVLIPRFVLTTPRRATRPAVQKMMVQLGRASQQWHRCLRPRQLPQRIPGSRQRSRMRERRCSHNSSACSAHNLRGRFDRRQRPHLNLFVCVQHDEAELSETDLVGGRSSLAVHSSRIYHNVSPIPDAAQGKSEAYRTWVSSHRIVCVETCTSDNRHV